MMSTIILVSKFLDQDLNETLRATERSRMSALEHFYRTMTAWITWIRVTRRLRAAFPIQYCLKSKRNRKTTKLKPAALPLRSAPMFHRRKLSSPKSSSEQPLRAVWHDTALLKIRRDGSCLCSRLFQAQERLSPQASLKTQEK